MADSTVQPGLKEELAQAIKEMDARTGSFSEAEVLAASVQQAIAWVQIPQLAHAFFFSPRRKDDAPFPGYFQPPVWFTAPDGSTVYSPDPASLTSAALVLWRERLQECVHPVLRPSWRRDRPGTGPHPGWRSFPEKNGESEAASSTLAAAQYMAAQLLITNHPVLLSNARARVFVHRSFF